jgi:transglutaminase-like putative cysteine protease
LEEEFGFQHDRLKVVKGGINAWRQVGYPIEKGAASSPNISRGQHRSVELSYSVTLGNMREETDKASIWIPIPRSNSVQSLEDFRLSDDVPYTILTDEKYNNRFLHFELSEDQIRNSGFSLTVFFRVHRKSYKKRELNDDVYPGTDNPLKRFLSPNSLVPIDGKIAQEARSVVQDVKEPSRQAKLLFDHIVATVEYDKSGTGWGLGDALYACDVRSGNCTDFHSLFIGEARSLGIPARFIIGFPLPLEDKAGTIPGYHCWAEFYIEGKGWVPLDASEARKHQEEKEKYFGNLDANRIAFTLGRDIQLPRAHSKPVKNYVIYPYAEANGKEIPVDWRMSFKDL